MRSHCGPPCQPWPCATPIRRWYREQTSEQIGRTIDVTRAHLIELNFFDAWHRQHVDDAGLPAGQSLVFLDRQQHMRGPTPIGDEDGTVLGCLFGAAGILIELAA